MPQEDPNAAAPAAKPDRLTRLNTVVTVLAGICTLFIGVWVKLNEVHLKEIEETTKRIESREKVEEASYKFAREFLGQIKDHFTNNSTRGTQMAVAALNIIAQASSGDDGRSSAGARAELPVRMALLLGDAGSIVTLDPQQVHLDEWCEFAAVDDDDRTRVTAIRALCALCRQSVRGGFLGRVDNCTVRIDQLYRLLADSASSVEQRTLALVAKSKLLAFLTQHDKDLRAAKLPPGDPRSAPAVVAGILARFEDTVSATQESAAKLRAVNADELAPRRDVEPLGAVGAGPGFPPPQQQQQQQQQQQYQALASVNEALEAVAFARTTSAAISAAPPQPSLPTATPGPAEDERSAEIGKLIGRLASADAVVRRKARSDLALLRQAAVKPMFERLREPFANEDTAYNTRLGVATALSRMVQPILLDQQQAMQVAVLVGAPDVDTRMAAADFLMNLENSATIQGVYEALAILIKDRKGPKESGNLVKNAAGIIGTWARVLSEDIKAPNDAPMKVFAAQTAEALKNELERTDAAGWSDTIAMLKELLQRANAKNRRAAY